jgi:phosphoglycolate phosphatase
MVTHVIFDLDGTLLDTLEDLADATNWVCARHGWPGHPVEAFKQFVGNGAPKLMGRAVPAEVTLTDELRGQLLEEFTRRYTAHKSDKTKVYAGMPQALARLKGAGLTLAVLTNKPHQAAAPIVERYYPGIFDQVQGALPQYPTKPDPTLLKILMEKIGAGQATTLFVGDSNVDIQTAKNGGLVSCGVLWGFRTRQELEAERADHIVETPEALAELILTEKV